MTGISLPTGKPGSRISGLGHFRPEKVVTNDDLAAYLDTNDEWIRTRVGIESRRFGAPADTVPVMGAAAGRMALEDAGLSADEVDTVIVATCTLPSQIPHAATQVARELGIVRPGAFDVNAACAGFSYGLAVASSLVRGGEAKNVLLVGSERLTDWVEPNDRANAIIFADGAGAAVVTGSDTAEIGPVAWGCEIEHTETIHVRDRESFIYQEGQTVFRWASTQIAPVAIEAAQRAGVELSEIAALIPHQANLRIVEGIAKRVIAAGARPDIKVGRDIVTSGNTSSASIPMALDRMRRAGEVASGDLVLVVGYGAGLTFSGQVFRCP